MFGFKIFICSLFVWLSYASPQEFSGEISTIENQKEILISSLDFNHHALIVDDHLEPIRVNGGLKTFKIASHNLNVSSENPKDENYDHRLLYLEISNAIPLKLTPREIIFPFHSFT